MIARYDRHVGRVQKNERPDARAGEILVDDLLHRPEIFARVAAIEITLFAAVAIRSDPHAHYPVAVGGPAVHDRIGPLHIFEHFARRDIDPIDLITEHPLGIAVVDLAAEQDALLFLVDMQDVRGVGGGLVPGERVGLAGFGVIGGETQNIDALAEGGDKFARCQLEDQVAVVDPAIARHIALPRFLESGSARKNLRLRARFRQVEDGIAELVAGTERHRDLGAARRHLQIAHQRQRRERVETDLFGHRLSRRRLSDDACRQRCGR